MSTETNAVIFDPTTKKNIDQWLQGHYDIQTKEIIRKLIQENPQEAVDAFYTGLSFGTAGLRGIMGVGCNRLNKYTIGAATQGLANYINKQPKPKQGHSVLIGYDSRINSKEFAEESANVLAANGIKAYIFKELRPTPLVSFGCRHKHCTAAIMITASHNPANYNGYKVYWNDGGQVLPPHDKKIIEEVNAITDTKQVKHLSSLSNPLIDWIDTEIDDAYYKAITPLQYYPQENLAYGKKLKIVYTSLHGTGMTLMPRTLALWGFPTFTTVASQAIPDGNFPTVKSPNPEERSALQLGIETLINIDGDILIATDPDADRVAVAVKHKSEVCLLSGNQIACICLNHICEALTRKNGMPPRAVFIKTIVTTELFQAICDSYQRPCINVLPGFKYIAEKIREWEQDPNGYQYIFGGEESYGYLLGTLCRDKDAILTSALLCEVALHAKLQGKTLIDLLDDLYKKHGVYFEKLMSLQFEESKIGKERMVNAMTQLRNNSPRAIAGIEVIATDDFLTSIKMDILTGEKETITIPKSDVLIFWLKDGTRVIVRPSGTEPKIKIYCGVIEKGVSSEAATIECEKRANIILTALKKLVG